MATDRDWFEVKNFISMSVLRTTKKIMSNLAIALSLIVTATPLWSAAPESAAQAMTALGLELYRQMPKEGNLSLSPYSIQSALAMTYLGSSGVTQEEMARVLHFPANKQTLGEAFAALNQSLEEATKASQKDVAEAKERGGPGESITLRAVNQLFGQQGYEFVSPFLADVDKYFAAPMKLMNFIIDSAEATREINDWVATQTRDRIRELIPANVLTMDTRLVLVNALYFKGAWVGDFPLGATQPAPFHVNGGMGTVDVPTMRKWTRLRY